MEYAEIYMDLSSAKIDGDAQAEHYVGQIELIDWAWGMSLEEAPSNDAAVGTKQAVGEGITIKKPVDGASTGMLTYLESGELITKAALVLVQRTEQNLMVRLEFKNMVLMSCKLNVDSDDKEVKLSENWTFKYDEISIQYKGRSGASDVRGKTPQLASPKFTLVNPRSKKEPTYADLEEKSESSAPTTSTPRAAKLDKDEVFKLIAEYNKNPKNK